MWKQSCPPANINAPKHNGMYCKNALEYNVTHYNALRQNNRNFPLSAEKMQNNTIECVLKVHHNVILYNRTQYKSCLTAEKVGSSTITILIRAA